MFEENCVPGRFLINYFRFNLNKLVQISDINFKLFLVIKL